MIDQDYPRAPRPGPRPGEAPRLSRGRPPETSGKPAASGRGRPWDTVGGLMGLAVVTAFAIADREPLVSLITLVGGLIGLVVLGGLTLLLTVILPLGIFLEFAINLLRRELSPGLAFEEKPTDTGPARPVDDERSKVRG